MFWVLRVPVTVALVVSSRGTALRHCDRLRDLTGRELRVNTHILADFQFDVLALERLEAGGRDANRIYAWIQVGRVVFSRIESATKFRATPVCEFVTATVAPAITPPDWSVTVPRIRPVLICENNDKDIAKMATVAPDSSIIFRTFDVK